MAGPTNIFSSFFKMFRFAASATVGLPLALAATSALLVVAGTAEAVNIIETHVHTNIKGKKKVHANPFFQKISDGAQDLLKGVWKEALYAPNVILQGTVSVAREAFKEEETDLMKAVKKIPSPVKIEKSTTDLGDTRITSSSTQNTSSIVTDAPGTGPSPSEGNALLTPTCQRAVTPT